MGDIIQKRLICQVTSAFIFIHITTNFSLAFETAYMLKYIDLSGRSNTDLWSIRQMAIYQNFNISTSHSDNLLIRSSDQIQKRISHLVHSKSTNTLPTHWTNIHSIYLGTLSHNWGSYISWIDTLISQVDFNYFFTKVGGEVPNRLHFEDLQLLNKGIDVLSQMAQALALNIEVLTLLSQEAARRAVIEGDKEKGRYEAFQQDIRTSITEQSFFKQHVGLLQTFADRRSVQVSYSSLLFPFSSLLGKSANIMKFAATRCDRPTRQQCHDGNEPKNHPRNPNNAYYHRPSSFLLACIIHSCKLYPLIPFPRLPFPCLPSPSLIKHTDLTHKKDIFKHGFHTRRKFRRVDEA
jgi:hypothetical protein